MVDVYQDSHHDPSWVSWTIIEHHSKCNSVSDSVLLTERLYNKFYFNSSTYFDELTLKSVLNKVWFPIQKMLQMKFDLSWEQK